MHWCRVGYQNSHHSLVVMVTVHGENGSENMFVFPNKVGLVRRRDRRGGSAHGSEVWNKEIQSGFIQAVTAMTPCSPPLLSSFHTLSSCLLPTCSQGHIDYFSIYGNSQAPSLLSFISTPYQLFLPLPRLLHSSAEQRSSYSQLDPKGLISLTVYLFVFWRLICWGVVHLSKPTKY